MENSPRRPRFKTAFRQEYAVLAAFLAALAVYILNHAGFLKGAAELF